MTEIELKNRLGIFLIITHFAVLLLVIVLSFSGGFEFPEMTTSISLITPMFASYSAIIIKYIVRNRKQFPPDSSAVTHSFVFIAFFLPSVFILVLMSVIILKAVSLVSFEEFKAMIAISETIFGIYIGLVVFPLFEKKKDES